MKSLFWTAHPREMSVWNAIAETTEYELTCSSDGNQAQAILDEGETDILFISASTIDRVMSLTQVAVAQNVYVVIVRHDMLEDGVIRCFEVGARDYIEPKLTRESYIDVMKAAEQWVAMKKHSSRRLKKLRNMFCYELVGEQLAKAAANPFPPSTSIAEFLLETKTWPQVDVAIMHSFRNTFGIAVKVASRPLRMTQDAILAMMTLTDSSKQLQLTAFLVLQPQHTFKEKCQIFKDGDIECTPEIILDYAREALNISMGGLKGLFAREQYKFSLSIPKAADWKILSEHFETSPPQKVRYFGNRSIFAAIALCVSIGQTKEVPLEHIIEGMLLAENVYNERGMLLARSGTLLSDTTAKNLRLNGHKSVIQVLSV